jgi:hypothetical protein
MLNQLRNGMIALLLQLHSLLSSASIDPHAATLFNHGALIVAIPSAVFPGSAICSDCINKRAILNTA